jgi:hypothetical protein
MNRLAVDAPHQQVEIPVAIEVRQERSATYAGGDRDARSLTDLFEATVPCISEEQVGAEISPNDVEVYEPVSVHIAARDAARDASFDRPQSGADEAMFVSETDLRRDLLKGQENGLLASCDSEKDDRDERGRQEAK